MNKDSLLNEEFKKRWKELQEGQREQKNLKESLRQLDELSDEKPLRPAFRGILGTEARRQLYQYEEKT